MEDQEIIDLYRNRDETAISATSKKYGNYCYSIAYNILYNIEDTEESVNDTYLSVWNSIPPHEPAVLSAFLGKITRYISLKRRRDKYAQKRGGGEIALAYEELADCIPAKHDIDTELEAKDAGKATVRFPFRKLAIAAAIALVCFGSVPALAAADVEPAYNLLYNISPALAQKFKPVNLSCVDQEIQLEVDSAYIHGNTAEAIICIKDLSDDRIDQTVDLFDSYNIRNIKDSSGTCNLLDYNEDTGVATFSVLMEQMDGSSLTGSKVTVSLSRLLCKKGQFNGVLEDITLSSVTDSPVLIDSVKIRGGGGAPYPDNPAFLQPASAPLLTPLPGISVTGLGYENGRLHVQICYEDIGTTDNHGWLWLQDENGEELDCSYNVSFWDASLTDSYDEYFFELPYEELGNYKLYAEFVNSGLLIEGDWEITFPMEQVK